MAGIPSRLDELLKASEIDYELISHHPDHTASQTAWDTHTPYGAFAKTLFVWVDGELAVAVLPADDRLSESKLALSLDAGEVVLANEADIQQACPECELGAAPPLEPFHGLPVYLSLGLGAHERVTFNAGSHRVAVRMPYRDFLALSEGRVVPLARHD